VTRPAKTAHKFWQIFQIFMPHIFFCWSLMTKKFVTLTWSIQWALLCMLQATNVLLQYLEMTYYVMACSLICACIPCFCRPGHYYKEGRQVLTWNFSLEMKYYITPRSVQHQTKMMEKLFKVTYQLWDYSTICTHCMQMHKHWL